MNQVGHCSFQSNYKDKTVKESEHKVFFSESYPDDGTTPKVLAAINLLDCNTHDRNTRIRVNIKDITNKSFIIHVQSWSDSLTWRVDVQWFASIDKRIHIGHIKHDNLKGEQLEGHDGNPKEKSSRITFPTPFQADGPIPSVALALKSLDIDNYSGNTRVSINISDVDREGFTLTSSTWFDSYIWEVGSYWIASTSSEVQITQSIGTIDDPKVFREDSVKKIWRTASKETSVSDNFFSASLLHSRLSVRHICGLTQLDLEKQFTTRIHVETNPSTNSINKLLTKFSTWWDSVCYTQNASIISAICLPSEQVIIKMDCELPEFPPDYEYIFFDGSIEKDGSISSGCHGTTFFVRHKLDKHHYALKVIKNFDADKDAYLRELNNLAELPFHNNILRYFTSTIFQGRLFIAAEYIDGCTFHDLLQLNPSKENIRTVALQLFSGLKHFHMKPMVHRDLHQYNILLRYKEGTKEVDFNNPRCVVIIDVGNAKQIAKQGEGVSFMNGNVKYFSPERFENQPFNDKDDVWAASYLICELILGKHCELILGLGGKDLNSVYVNDFLREVVVKDNELGSIMKRVLSAREPVNRPNSHDVQEALAKIRL